MAESIPPLRMKEADGDPNLIPVFVLEVSGATLTKQNAYTARLLIDSGAGSSGAPVGSQYVTLAFDPSLTAERVLVAGTGMVLTDLGANNSLLVSLVTPVVVPSGGTGAATFTAFGVLYGSGASAIQALPALSGGALYIGSGSNVRPFVLTSGNAGQVLAVSAGAVGGLAWQNTAGGGSSVVYAPTGGEYLTFVANNTLTAELVLTAGTGLSTSTDSTSFFVHLVTPVSVASGGTGTTTHTAFGLVYGSGGSALQTLTGLSGGTLVVGSGSNVKPFLLTSGAIGQMLTVSAGVVGGLAWVPTANIVDVVTSGRTLTAGAGLSGGGDLSADRTFSLVTPVAVTSGGTGASTLTAFGVLYGSGVSAVQALAALATGSLVVGSGTTVPPQVLTIGSQGQVLSISGGTRTGLAWITTLAGAAATKTIRLPMGLLTVQPDSGNAYWTVTNGATMDYGYVRYVDSGDGISTWWADVPSNLAAVPAWGLDVVHEPITGGSGNVVVTVKARRVAHGGQFDGAYTLMASAAALPIFTAGSVSIVSVSGGNFDSVLALTQTGALVVELTRNGAASGDTVSGDWGLFSVRFRVDVT